MYKAEVGCCLFIVVAAIEIICLAVGASQWLVLLALVFSLAGFTLVALDEGVSTDDE